MYDYENSPEPELIRRAGKGDVKAFSQLYAGIYKDLYRFCPVCHQAHTGCGGRGERNRRRGI